MPRTTATDAWRLLRPSLLAFAFLAACGCGSQRYKVTEVKGQLTQNGEPMSKIFVEFVPDVDKGVDGPASTGVTDEDGRFRLRLMLPGGKSKMGAVIGWHRVVLTDVGRPVTPPIPPPRVAPRFSNYESTPLTKEVVKDGGLYKIELTGDTTTDQQAKQ